LEKGYYGPIWTDGIELSSNYINPKSIQNLFHKIKKAFELSDASLEQDQLKQIKDKEENMEMIINGS
jgi:hypothetical protein